MNADRIARNFIDRPRFLRIVLLGTALCALLAGFAGPLHAAALDDELKRIDHVIVIYAENRSFDNLYGLFPGADGIANATPAQIAQRDRDGRPLDALPPVWGDKSGGFPTYDMRRLPVGPFRIDRPPLDLPLSIPTRDLVHRFWQHQMQINGGRNDMFVAYTDAGGLTMGYYDGSSLPMWKLAQQYTLADAFFMGTFGGSFINHIYLVCACAPVFPDPDPSLVPALDAQGRLQPADGFTAGAIESPPAWKKDGLVTPDGYAVNTLEPRYQPSAMRPAANADPRYAAAEEINARGEKRFTLPPQTMPTIGDRLSDKGISWAWYAGGWNLAVADGMQRERLRSVIKSTRPGSINFQTHHQPFNYFERFAPGSVERELHLRDAADFFSALETGALPQVSFYKPIAHLNQHPGYTDVLSGDRHIAETVARIQASPLWSSSLVIVTYDENGGYWDHVAPPQGDRFGPGSRVPAIIISPWAKKGYVDHTPYDTGSIIKFLTRRFALEPLPGVRAGAGDLTKALAF